ncbi:MAG: hypothetical protein H6709_01170 [Kofleriaceae bacterium]|nr:hypothetical protein [Kofleriaceae bacterium]
MDVAPRPFAAVAAAAAALIATGCGQRSTTPDDGGRPAPAHDAEIARAPADAAPPVTAVDELPGFGAIAVATPASDELAAQVARRAQVRDRRCDDDGDARGLLAATGDVDHGRPGDETVAVSLARGVVALAGDTLVAATNQPLTRCDGSQTELTGAWLGQLVPDPELEVVVVYSEGGHAEGATHLTVLKRRGARFVVILAHELTSWAGDDETAHAIRVLPDGTLEVAGERGPERYGWDEARGVMVTPPPSR